MQTTNCSHVEANLLQITFRVSNETLKRNALEVTNLSRPGLNPIKMA